jgi:protocatechuate 3,4-dioxygenase, alpha subunit
VRTLTPSQTVGPFFHCARPFSGRASLVVEGTRGQPIVVEGTVRDGAGAPVGDALIETWQADAGGRYHHPDDLQDETANSFAGLARVATGEDGGFAIETVKPGGVPGPAGRMQAPHIVVSVLGRGLLTRLVSRIYFEGESANERDPILQCVPVERRRTLIARQIAEGRYRFDLVLQGEDETVFFDV